jgi:hypothetical protein
MTGWDLLADHALGRALPEADVVLPELELRLDQIAGLAHPALHQLDEGLADLRVSTARRPLPPRPALLPCQEILDQPATPVGDLAQYLDHLLGLRRRYLLLLSHVRALIIPRGAREAGPSARRPCPRTGALVGPCI